MGVIAGAIALFLLYAAFDSVRSRRRFAAFSAVPPPEPDLLAFPYYVESDGLRTLAADLKIQLPLSREVTKSRRFSGRGKVFDYERGRSEATQFGGEINLNRLADNIMSTVPPDRVCTTLTLNPPEAGGGVMEQALAMIEAQLERVTARAEILEALEQVKQVYESEQVTAAARRKREELEEVGRSNRLIVMAGEFGRHDINEQMGLRLTRFELYDPRMIEADLRLGGPEYEYWLRMAEAQALTDNPTQLRIVSEPPGVTDVSGTSAALGVVIQVVLPDAAAFKAAGMERIGRGQPFYGRVIAHSPSYDAETLTLTCSAYAAWGVTRPNTAPYARPFK